VVSESSGKSQRQFCLTGRLTARLAAALEDLPGLPVALVASTIVDRRGPIFMNKKQQKKKK